WMAEYGLDYVVFDWYWDGASTVRDHSINGFIASRARQGLEFSLLWANHDDSPRSKDDFHAMVKYWLAHYFRQSGYLTIDGKPVVFFFSHSALEKKARAFGSSAKELIGSAQALARASGFPGLYIVANTISDGNVVNFGYSAMSAYNYHGL